MLYDNQDNANKYSDSTLYTINELNLKNESFFSLKIFRSNSCKVPSIIDLTYCKEFVPQLK